VSESQIHWFPGHMNKARREIKAALARIDVVIEVLDARLPRASANPMLEQLRGARPCLRVLAKADLADPEVTRAWLKTLAGQPDVRTLALDASRAGAVRGVPRLCRELAPQRRGPGKPVRCLVVGIPNVGKSTLINSLVGRRVARVGDRPAITRGQQRVQLDADVVVSDTPGVLWPKLEDQQAARRLAASGAIGEAAFDVREVACFAAGFLAQSYPALLKARYGLESLPDEPHRIVEAVGRRRGFLVKGGDVDFDRAAEVLLRELRSGLLGRISFERPETGPAADEAPADQ